jgi:hypothetical protein
MDEKKIPVAAILAVTITLGFFVVMILLLARSSADHEARDVMLGALVGGWTAIIGYYFGSSMGSRAKTDLLAQEQKLAIANQKSEIANAPPNA